jgi:hypothetical protein
VSSEQARLRGLELRVASQLLEPHWSGGGAVEPGAEPGAGGGQKKNATKHRIWTKRTKHAQNTKDKTEPLIFPIPQNPKRRAAARRSQLATSY